MKIEYTNDLKDALKYARTIKNCYNAWQKSKSGYKHQEKGVAYKNFLLIFCYGKIENTFKKIISDYFLRNGMPQRCIDFGNKIRDALPGSMAKDKLNNWIRKECSIKWFDEIDKRCKDKNWFCKKNRTLLFNDAYLALTSLTNLRHDLAHGTNLYSGRPEDIITYFIKSIAWLHEIDDIIKIIG